MKKISILISMIFLFGKLFAQFIDLDYTVTHKADYMLPSAESISKIKEIVRPSGLYTGIPEITIPLWKNQYSDFSINLKYHASGIQVNEEASSVGLGWSIDAGGLITRVVRGIPDDLSTYGYLNMALGIKSIYNMDLDEYTNANTMTLNNVSDSYDSSPDMFYYNFNGIKGKFSFDENGNIISIPKNNLKIKYHKNTSNIIDVFYITTPDGLEYKFSVNELINITSGPEYTGYSSYTSAWYLKSVSMIDRQLVTYGYNWDEEVRTRKLYDYEYFNENGIKVSGTAQITMSITVPKVSYIQDQNTEVYFLYNDDDELEKINIKAIDPNKEYSITKPTSAIAFTYDNFDIDNSTLDETRSRKLTGIKIGSGLKHNFIFDYYTNVIPNINSTEQDIWGYFNDNNTTSLLPRLNYENDKYESIALTSANISGADRTTNSSVIMAGMLKTIENPEGGMTEYVYEPQKFIYNEQVVQGGGLRIKDILYYDPNSVYPDKKISYKYVQFDGTAETGVLLSKPNFAYNLKYNPHYFTYDKLTYRYANYSYGLSASYSNPVFYTQVTTDLDGIGYNVKDFELPVGINSVVFSDALDQTKNLAVQNVSATYDIEVSYLGNDFDHYFIYDWNNAYIMQETNYDANKLIVNKTIYTYSDYLENTKAVHGFMTSPKVYCDIVPTVGEETIEYYKTLRKFYYCTAWKLLKQKEDINYVDGESFTRITNYEYNQESGDIYYRLPNETDWTDVNGNKHFREVRYPFQFTTNLDQSMTDYTDDVKDEILNHDDAYVTQFDANNILLNKSISPDILTSVFNPFVSDDNMRVALAAMKIRGNVATPIEVIEGIEIGSEKKIIKSILTKYKLLDNQSIVPTEDLILEGPVDYDLNNLARIENNIFKYSTEYKKNKEYITYSDLGELRETRGADGVITAYKYSDRGNYLIAKAVNANYSSIQSYDGIESTEPSRAGDRLITTYKYKPLVGISRETDHNGLSTYYIYDGDGNLLAVKDNDKNIREVYSKNWLNKEGTQNVDLDTEPDGNRKFLETEPKAQIEAITSEDFHNASLTINNYNPAFDYEIDFGDGTSEIVTEQSIIHYYPDMPNFVVRLREMKNGYTLNESTATVDFPQGRLPMEVNIDLYDFIDKSTLLSLNNDVIKSLKVTLTISKGMGKYTVNWKLENVDSNSIVNNFTVQAECDESIDYKFGSEGKYKLTCTISDGIEQIVNTWYFTIDQRDNI